MVLLSGVVAFVVVPGFNDDERVRLGEDDEADAPASVYDLIDSTIPFTTNAGAGLVRTGVRQVKQALDLWKSCVSVGSWPPFSAGCR